MGHLLLSHEQCGDLLDSLIFDKKYNMNQVNEIMAKYSVFNVKGNSYLVGFLAMNPHNTIIGIFNKI